MEHNPGLYSVDTGDLDAAKRVIYGDINLIKQSVEALARRLELVEALTGTHKPEVSQAAHDELAKIDLQKRIEDLEAEVGDLSAKLVEERRFVNEAYRRRVALQERIWELEGVIDTLGGESRTTHHTRYRTGHHHD